MCRICYSVDNRLTDIGVTGKTAAATANASVKVFMWHTNINKLPY